MVIVRSGPSEFGLVSFYIFHTVYMIIFAGVHTIHDSLLLQLSLPVWAVFVLLQGLSLMFEPLKGDVHLALTYVRINFACMLITFVASIYLMSLDVWKPWITVGDAMISIEVYDHYREFKKEAERVST